MSKEKNWLKTSSEEFEKIHKVDDASIEMMSSDQERLDVYKRYRMNVKSYIRQHLFKHKSGETAKEIVKQWNAMTSEHYQIKLADVPKLLYHFRPHGRQKDQFVIYIREYQTEDLFAGYITISSDGKVESKKRHFTSPFKSKSRWLEPILTWGFAILISAGLVFLLIKGLSSDYFKEQVDSYASLTPAEQQIIDEKEIKSENEWRQCIEKYKERQWSQRKYYKRCQGFYPKHWNK